MSFSRYRAQIGTAFAGFRLSKLTSHDRLGNLASGQFISSLAGRWKSGATAQERSIMNAREAATTFGGWTFQRSVGGWKSGVPGFVGFNFATSGSAKQVD